MIKIWDKLESINGVSAKDVLDNRKDLEKQTEVILIIDDITGQVTNIEIPEILRSNFNFSNTLTALEVGQAYVEHLNDEKTKSEQEKATTEQRISDLETLVLISGGVI